MLNIADSLPIAETERIVGTLAASLWRLVARNKFARFVKRPFRTLIENSTDVISLFSADGTVQYLSPSVARIAGYKETEPIGRNFSEFVHPDDLAYVLKSFQDLQKKVGAAVTVTCRYRHKDGSWRWLECIWSNHLGDSSIGAIVGNLRDITDRKVADDELHRSEERLRALANQITSVREQEAKRLSREIHDQMGGALTALKLEARTLQRDLETQVGPIGTKESKETLAKMIKSIDETLSAARRMSADLRPATLDELGLVAALEEEARAFEARSCVFCNLLLPENEPLIDPEKGTAMFRIFQEALTNVARHANASEVSIQLVSSDGRVRLTVADNGRGLPQPRPSGGFGLIGMQERALAAGIRLEIGASKGGGTTVVVES